MVRRTWLGSLCGLAFVFASLSALAAPPPVRVAVFDDPAYVDTAGLVTSESDNVQAALLSLGFTVTTFTGVTDVAWRNATSTVDVVVVPDLQIADLAAAMSANAEQAIVDFVDAGGVLIVQGNSSFRQTGLINSAFGLALNSVAGQIANLQDLATGTRFVQGPASLPLNAATVGFGGLPAANTILVYVSPASVHTVAALTHGAGKVVCMGWNWNNAAPVGAQDGGWNEVLRRAVLEGRPPTRRVAVLDDPAFVDSAGGAAAESDALQAALGSRDMLVAPFSSSSGVSIHTALGDERRPSADALVIPELSVADLAFFLDGEAAFRIHDFVSTGGTLIVSGGSFSQRAADMINGIVGIPTTGGPAVGGTSTLADPAGTLFAGAPPSLTNSSATSTLAVLPPEAQVIYTSGGQATVALIPYGEGRIFFLGWDFFNAAPLGATDGGWLDVLDRAIRTAPPARRVAVFADPAYVDSEETVVDAAASAEAINMQASLALRGHVPQPFFGTTQLAWSAALAGADALVVPDQEVAEVTPALDAATRAEVVAFVKRGGLLVVPSGGFARGVSFVNALFGTAMSTAGIAGPYPANDERLGTPFEVAPLSIPQNNATTNFMGVPEEGRVIYGTTTNSPVAWLQFGAGHVLMLGWDWYGAVSAGGGTQDGGWVDVLDLAVQSARPRSRRVAVFDSDTYVDTLGGPSSESDAVQASLTSLDHTVRAFTSISAGALTVAIGGADAVLIPELSLADLSQDVGAEWLHEMRNFVAAGGALVVHGSPGGRAANVLNRVFGWNLSSAGGLVTPPTLDPTAAQGTRFAGLPGSVGSNNFVDRLTGLPFGGRSIYTDVAAQSIVSWIPYGRGRVVYLGWDFFNAAPLGAADSGWLSVLDRAVQEARPRTRRLVIHRYPLANDTALGHEADNLERALESVGEAPDPQYRFPKTQAVVIPELEVGQSTVDFEALRGYVARGNVLLLSLDGFGRAAQLLGTAFGFPGVGSADTAQGNFQRHAGTADTPFGTGPFRLFNLNTTRVLTNPPASTVRLYDDGAGGNLAVAAIPYGAGVIVVFGWDFTGQRPYDFNDIGQAAWRDVLRRALDLAPPDARRVAVLDDPAYVDTGGGAGSESDAVQASLLMLEHAVVPFTGIAQTNFFTALSRADVLLVPEQSVASLGPALTVAARNEINSFVNGGGGLVVHGTAVGTRSSELLNTLFGYTLNENAAADPNYGFATPPLGDTQFDLWSPNFLEHNSATIGLTNATYPPSTAVAYRGPTNLKAVVAVFKRGHGRSVYLGWDWFNASPLGPVDGGWIDVLDRAVREGMGGDADGDGVSTTVDLCPWVADGSQADGDLDGVGDYCDNCQTVSNPRVPLGADDFLTGNPWATLTGMQRDDDHDGFGNQCDAKFPGVAGLFVGQGDLNEFRASNTKNRTLDTCGTIGTRPCAIFDLDETGLFIGQGDLDRFRALNTKSPGPKCPYCPLPCDRGLNGSCN